VKAIKRLHISPMLFFSDLAELLLKIHYYVRDNISHIIFKINKNVHKEIIFFTLDIVIVVVIEVHM